MKIRNNSNKLLTGTLQNMLEQFSLETGSIDTDRSNLSEKTSSDINACSERITALNSLIEHVKSNQGMFSKIVGTSPSMNIPLYTEENKPTDLFLLLQKAGLVGEDVGSGTKTHSTSYKELSRKLNEEHAKLNLLTKSGNAEFQKLIDRSKENAQIIEVILSMLKSIDRTKKMAIESCQV